MDNKICDDFAANLREQIARKGVSQRYLAQQFGVSQQIISQWCNGRKMPRPGKLAMLAEYFNCDVSTLLNNTDSLSKISAKAMEIGTKFDKLSDVQQKIVSDLIDSFLSL